MRTLLAAVAGFAAVLHANAYETPAHLKYPYVAVKYVTPTLSVGERCRIGWYVTDFNHSLWRFADDTRRFDVFATWTKDDANWQTVSREGVPSCDGEFDLGELPAGEYSVGVWCRDRLNGLESHRVWHEFRVVEKGALDIPESAVRRMTAADLTAYGLRNDGEYERFVLIDAFDPATRNGGQFNLKIDEITKECLEIVDAYLAEHPHVSPGGRPGYTVYTAAWKGAPIDRAFYRKRLRYDDGYDKDAVAAIAEANSLGLQKFLDDAAAAGCRKVVLLPGTYRVSHLHTLNLPDRMTVDLGGATLKLNGFDGAGTLMVRFAGVTDTHLVNGTVEGDYYEHSYVQTTSPEQVHGWCFSGACRYCSVEGVTTKNVTGYGGGNGEGKGLGAGCTTERSLSGANCGFIPGGLAADGTVDASDPAQWTSPYVDITAYKPYHYFTVSYGLGYAGVRTRNWTYRCAFYDEGLNFLSRVTAFQYRVVRIPPAAKYARISIEVANEQEALSNELTMRLPYVPRNCIVAHNVYDRCRCVGHASSAMSNFLFLENEFRYSGECQATCAYDAEDGWDNMQDVLFLRNDFHDNNRNELLTCCGHNFQMVGNRAKISLNARTFAPCVVSNDCKSASFDCSQRTRTGYARYFDNRYRGSLALGSGGYSDWDVVLRGLHFPLPGETGPTTVTGTRNGRFSGCTFSNITVRVQRAENCAFVSCESGLDRWQNGLWNDCTVTDCTFAKQSCTNRYVKCAFDRTSFASMTLKTLQEFADCTLVGTTFPKSPNFPPEFYNCTGVPSGYANVRAVYVDAAAADGGDGSAMRPFRTIAEGLAAARDGVTLVEVAGGTYEVFEPLVVGPDMTLRAARGAKVTVDAGYRCTALQADAAATVEGITVSRDISTRPVTPTPRTFHVDGSAAAGGDGSAGAPFRTIAEGVAAAQNEGDVVEVADGTYAIGETIVVDRPVVIRSASGAAVKVDANYACRCFSVNHADAVVEGLCIRRGKTTANSSCNGNGVLFGANGGTLRNCTVELCQGGIGSKGCGVYLNGGALVTGCTIRNCQANANGTEYGIGAYLANGTLERCLVTGCTRTGFKDSQPADGAVYVSRGTVRRCTIAGNSVSRATLHLADLPCCIVRDTVVWGNVTTRDTSAGRPNLGDIGVNPDISGLCTTIAVGRNPVAKNPSFVNASEGDYRLSCASPCRGAGTDGCDLGCFDYEPVGAPAIAVSASSGVGELQATVSLLADDPTALQGATIAWTLNGKAIDATGASFDWTFGPGAWDISAAVTYADGSTAEATLPRAVEVGYTGDIDVTPADDLNAIFDLARSGLRLHLAEGTYPVSRTLNLADDIRLIGAGDRTKTVLQRTTQGSGRVLYLNDARAFVANVTVTGGTGDREGGGVWIDADGGTVSNCVIRGNTSGTNAGGGGAYLNSPKAVLSHSLVASNTAGGSSAGGGVLLSQGTLADCLVISNGMSYSDRTASLGGGVCLNKATADAKVVNCTIARNRGYSGCGLYRKANAGFVYNTLIYDNVQKGTAELATPNWTSESGSTRPTETAFANCCSDVAVGANAQVVASAPYDAAYRLCGDAALACVDKGLNDAVFSSVDYDGATRILGGAVDIGAIECTTIEIGVVHVDAHAPSGGDGTRARPFNAIADGIAAAKDGEDTVKVATGTYPIAAALSVSKAITVMPETGASVTVDAQSKCQCLSINHADAVVEGIRLYRGQLSGNGAGVAIGTKGGTLRNCIIESCKCGASNNKGPGIYMNSANAVVTGCQVLRCGTGGFNGNYECHGVYIDNGTLDHTLVAGCSNTGTYSDGKKGTAAVYLAKGTVRNCTITGNEVSHYALYCADAASCIVTDTISWGNVSLRGVAANGPNANDIGAKADVRNLWLENPMFGEDYSLAPGSPCIGAGTDGCDLGWKPFDAAKPAIGIRITVGAAETAPPQDGASSRGGGVSPALIELTAANVDLSGATVVWEGLEETGTSFTKAFGGGVHALKATVTFADGTEMAAENSVSVAYAPGEYEVKTATELEQMLASPLSDGVVIRLPEGTFEILGKCYAIRNGVKIVGAGREKTILKKNLSDARGRFFYLNHVDAEIDNLTLYNAMAACSAGGVWIDGRGGTVSNCTVRGCKTGASQAGGGVWINSPNALVTHSVVSKNTVGQNTYCGGVLLSQGTLADSLIVSNTAQYSTRTQVKGVGVYMDTATADAKVVNCTIARNTGYQSVGLYRVANGGYVSNTIIYDNTASDHNADDNFYSGGGATRSTAAAILNCASSVALGTNPQTLSVLPYNPATYELDGSTGGACIDKGANEAVVSATDFYGNDRIFQGKTVDIGAHEYSNAEIELGFTASATKGVGSVEIVLTANVEDADSYAWYFDGADEPSCSSRVCTNRFAVGRHVVRLVAVVGGRTYEKVSDDKTGIVVYAPDVYVDANSAVEPGWPYPETAPATNFNAAVAEALVEGVTVHVAEGLYPMTARVTLGPNQHVVGAGMDRTVLYHPKKGAAGFHLKSPSSTVDGLCVSNSVASYGGGFRIEGGTVTRCRVTHCEAGINEDGGGVYVTGSSSVFDRGVVAFCSRYQWNGTTLANGGGVALDNGGTLRNSLVVRCTANNAGGVDAAGGSIVRNCTVVSNSCSTTGKGGGGIVATSDCKVENCIAWGNVDMDESDPTLAKHNIVGGDVVSCCFPVAVGEGCVTADPQFKDAANGDYRIGASSPCAYSGLYQSDWMDGATDFFGNPRATPGKKVSIGYCQAPDLGLMLIVK